MTKIISFSGVQSSGKTTMMNKLYEKLNKMNLDVITLPSITRDYINKLNIDLKELRKNKEGLKVWQYFTLKEHLDTLHYYIYENDCDYVITDRSHIDYLIYTQITINEEYKNYLEEEFNYIIDYIKYNSTIINTTPLKIEEDGIRDTSTFDEELNLFKNYENQFDLKLPSTTIDERMKIIMDYLYKNHNLYI